ncbi:hypothetical protein LPJ54_006657, partial [Coemansia sp. RSA 1824]
APVPLCLLRAQSRLCTGWLGSLTPSCIPAWSSASALPHTLLTCIRGSPCTFQS